MRLSPLAFEHAGDQVAVGIHLAAADRADSRMATVGRVAVRTPVYFGSELGDRAVLLRIALVYNAFNALARCEEGPADRALFRFSGWISCNRGSRDILVFAAPAGFAASGAAPSGFASSLPATTRFGGDLLQATIVATLSVRGPRIFGDNRIGLVSGPVPPASRSPEQCRAANRGEKQQHHHSCTEADYDVQEHSCSRL